MPQTRAVGNQAGLWRPSAIWSAEQQPAGLWPWLVHAGSLTEKLRAATGSAFHVQVLYEGVTQLVVEDARLLHTVPGTAARLREVYLCGDAPWVFARTLALADGGRWLEQLGAQALGERVFAAADTQRSPIEVAQLNTTQALYLAAAKHLPHVSPMLWARRSVLTVNGNRLLIYECFLPGMQV